MPTGIPRTASPSSWRRPVTCRRGPHNRKAPGIEGPTPGACALSTCSLRLRLWIFHAQIVMHRSEAQAGGRGANSGHILLHFVIHHAFQCYLAVLYDDVNGRNSLDAVTRKRRI